MKRILHRMLFWIVTFSVLTAPTISPASDSAQAFFSALEAYKAGDYASAVEQFSAIARSGVRNGRLFYNLGNACLKDRQLGPAIFWYERALRLLPNDPDLRFNLEYARSLTKDAPEHSFSQLLRILFFWKFQLSDRAIIGMAAGCNVIFWALLGTWHLTRRRSLLRAAVVLGMIAVVFVATAGYNYYEMQNPTRAIVLPDRVAVRSGLEDSSTELFVLHAGARVKVLEERRNFYLIRFSTDKVGWLDTANVGLID